VKRLSLTLSDKSKLIPETPTPIKVAKQLPKEGIPISTDDTADDVGVQLAGGAMRAETTLNERIYAKGAPRARRIRGLVMVNAEAKKLTMPGVQPTQSYGHVAMGASKAQQLGMRKNLKNATPFAGTASCTTSTIAFTYGLAADPLITCPVEQLDIWSQVWLAATGADKQDARVTWHRAVLAHLKEGKVGISLGPASATISALVDLGWKPNKPDHWTVDEATTIKLGKQPFTRLQILTRARRDMQCKLLTKAAEHCHGSGLELPPLLFAQP
jgi:hypothetical protein